jgi:phosphoesterase RecJ-like protein
MNKNIEELAPVILEAIQEAKSILLHCHPFADPDSVGSSLAMKFALEGMGKKVTVIGGDTPVPKAFSHFPGYDSISPQNFLETDLSQYDLFISEDSSSVNMISKKGPVIFPPNLKVIVIDHHPSNTRYGHINLVESRCPSNTVILYELFQIWGVKLDESIASNLFIGIYSDTSFKYSGVDSRVFEIASDLLKHIPEMSGLISKMENSNTPGYVTFFAAALGTIQTFENNLLAVATLDRALIDSLHIDSSDIRASDISSFMKTVPEWKIAVCAVEIEPGQTKFSLRTARPEYDLSVLLSSLGGGGHKTAAGLTLNMPAKEAVAKLVEKAKEMYNR